MKPLVLSIIGGSVAAVVIATIIIMTTYSPVAVSDKVLGSYGAGTFTAYMIEDNNRRLLAKVENNGQLLNSTAAFLVRQGYNNNCEPQGVVVSSFSVVTADGIPSAVPDYIPGNSNVTLDSISARIDTIPAGDNHKTTVYIMKLKPDSIIASGVIEQIPIQDADLAQLFEACLQDHGKGYPLLLKVISPPQGSTTYFTLVDHATGMKYQTTLDVRANAPMLDEIYWPPSREGWLAENFTKQGGPVPEWGAQEPSRQLELTVDTVDSNGEARRAVYPIELAEIQSSSIDFSEQAVGKIVPPYPRFWEIVVRTPR